MSEQSKKKTSKIAINAAWVTKYPDEEILAKINAEIDYVIEKYAFTSDFNLLQKILHLPTEIILKQNSNFPRLGKRKKGIEQTIKAAEKFRQILAKLPLQTKLDIDQAPQHYADKGYVTLASQNGDWAISKFSDDLDTLIRNSRFAIQLIDTDKGGQVPSSIPKFVMFWLAFFYEQGTGKKPTCGHADEPGVYFGEFYSFLNDIEPALKLLGIELGEFSTIGTYATDGLTAYRSIIQNLTELQT